MKKTERPATSKEGFINFPKDEYCTTMLSIAPPASGKTYVMLNCLKLWIDMKMFTEYHVVLPAFKNEMNGSYDWLLDYPNVFVYEKYYDRIGNDVVKRQTKSHELLKKKKIKEMPRVFFCIDDATSEKNIFESDAIRSLVTKNRHLHVHSWFLMHSFKGIIKPAIRQNIFFVFLYKLKDEFLNSAFKEFVNFPLDFDNYKKDFKPFFKEYIIPLQYGCLLLGGSRDYSPFVNRWFDSEDKK